jgi:hypothetical protein
MDVDQETAKFKWVLRFGIGLLITTFFAFGELKYFVFGTTVDATITKVQRVESRSRRSGTTYWTEVNYKFADNAGNQRTGSDRMDDDWNGPREGIIPITYRGGEDGPNRLAGHYNWFGLGGWLFFFLPTAFFFGGMVKESMDYAKEKKTREASRKKVLRY